MTVVFSTGNTTSQCIEIYIVDDEALEGNQTFIVFLNSSDSGVLLDNSVTTVTILDNDGIVKAASLSYYLYYYY